MDSRNADGGGADAARPVQLVTGRSDADVAEDLKLRLEEAIKPALAVMDEAVAAGLEIQFQMQRVQPFFKHGLVNFRIIKTIIA